MRHIWFDSSRIQTPITKSPQTCRIKWLTHSASSLALILFDWSSWHGAWSATHLVKVRWVIWNVDAIMWIASGNSRFNQISCPIQIDTICPTTDEALRCVNSVRYKHAETTFRSNSMQKFVSLLFSTLAVAKTNRKTTKFFSVFRYNS